MNSGKLIEAFAAMATTAGVPIRGADNSALLTELQRKLGRWLPQSLECLLVAYSFPPFDVGGISLFGWGRDVEVNEYFGAASAAEGSLSELLLPAGYWQIGRPDTGDFDAICIDLNHKAQNREHRIVRADHEEILCNWRVRITGELWPSFHVLIENAIREGASSIYYENLDLS
jgi:hypothetical protein